MGERVRAFEEAFARYIGTSEAVMVNSGASADLVIMWAVRELGLLKPGAEILLPAVTWPTQVWAVIEAGFSPRLVDVDTSTLNVTAEAIEAAITPKTKAISLVHLMGNPCEMDKIVEIANERKLLILEDCCESLGASFDGRKVGSFGLGAAFSFFHSHHITTMEGGMITTNDPQFADMCRSIRAHGWARDLRHRETSVDDSRYLFLGMGFNFRPTELNAAFGLCQLPKLDEFNRARERNAAAVQLQFRSTNGHTVEWLMPTSWKSQPAWFALPFVLRGGLPYTRKDVMDHLEKYGYESRPMVAGNIARQPAFQRFRNWTAGLLPGADVIHDRGLYVGLPPVETDMWGLINLLNGAHSHLST
jgi:CDP-6-deoxy-D-xylo-4-hexulose-3-dehydrase